MLSVAIRFHSLPLAALGKYIFSPHGKLELFALFVVENEVFGTSETLIVSVRKCRNECQSAGTGALEVFFELGRQSDLICHGYSPISL